MERTVGTPAPPVGEEPVLTGSQATVLQQSVPAALLLAGCALWLVSLPRIDPDRMTDLGLVSVLPLATFAALSLLVPLLLLPTSANASTLSAGSRSFTAALQDREGVQRMGLPPAELTPCL